MPTSTLLLCLTRDPVKHINFSIVPPPKKTKLKWFCITSKSQNVLHRLDDPRITK